MKLIGRREIHKRKAVEIDDRSIEVGVESKVILVAVVVDGEIQVSRIAEEVKALV